MPAYSRRRGLVEQQPNVSVRAEKVDSMGVVGEWPCRKRATTEADEARIPKTLMGRGAGSEVALVR